MGNKEVTFKSLDAANPAKFHVSSCPAHTTYPIVMIDISKAKKVPCGSVEYCNKRVINQYIHPEVIVMSVIYGFNTISARLKWPIHSGVGTKAYSFICAKTPAGRWVDSSILAYMGKQPK